MTYLLYRFFSFVDKYPHFCILAVAALAIDIYIKIKHRKAGGKK